MKKVALTLASVLAAAAFAPEASAIPSFARQTGMACSACHYMKFPVLNGFGRAFKANGYTMMGAQEKVEGEHLSIPGVLNASLLFKYRYVQDSGNGTAGNMSATDMGGGFKKRAGAGVTAPTGTADGQIQMADEFSLFFGGRVAETEHFNIGFMMENNVANPGGALVAGFKLPVNIDLGAAKITLVPFTTDALGVQYGYELSSGGVMRANRWAELRRETSAVQYNADRYCDGVGDCGTASGTAFVLQNDMGFINYTKWSSSFAPGANGQGVESTNFGQSYVRLAVTPNIAGFDIVAGGGVMSGTSYSNIATAEIASEQTFFDFQAHGSIAGMESGIYVQRASAAKSTATVKNSYNTETANDRIATTIGAEFSVIPHALTIGAAYRMAENGKASTVNGDNAVTLTAVYDLTQNVALHLDYATYSGSAHDLAGNQTSRILGMLEAAW